MNTLCIALLLVVSSAGTTLARPQYQQTSLGGGVPVTPIPILIDERYPIDAFGGYGFKIGTGNGIDWIESAAATGPLNQVVRNGAYAFTHPDGTVHQMRYVADALGFRPESNMLPTPFPLLPWQVEQVQFAEQQRLLQAQTAATGSAVL